MKFKRQTMKVPEDGTMICITIEKPNPCQAVTYLTFEQFNDFLQKSDSLCAIEKLYVLMPKPITLIK